MKLCNLDLLPVAAPKQLTKIYIWIQILEWKQKASEKDNVNWIWESILSCINVQKKPPNLINYKSNFVNV